MPRLYFAVALLGLTAAAAAQPADLLFSEYVEGSSFNKAVEIYNGTGGSVDLSDYTVELYSNGSGTVSQSVGLSGSLADGAVYVLAHGSSDAAVLAEADLLSNAVMNFNGDDAVVLRKSGAVVDAIGEIGFDPGSQWGSGLASTQDNTLRRKADTCDGFDGMSAFDPALAYDGFANNTFDGLGAHADTCGGGTGNAAPVFTAALADQTVAVGDVVAFTYEATDADADPLTFALDAGPTGATLNTLTGAFEWTPGPADEGLSVDITVSVTDGIDSTPTTAIITVAGPGGALFFSEYIEGSSNNKAVEIYNGTGGAVSLDGLAVQIYANGATSATSTISLSGPLAAGAVYVVAHSSSDPAILGVANQTTGSVNFNGDDAVALVDGAALLDVIGQIGVDPGSAWGSGGTTTANHTLRRVATSCTGDTNGSDAFDPATTFEGFPQDTFGGLGMHTATCGGTGGSAPFFTATLPSTLVDGGDAVAFNYTADDPEGDAVTFSLVGAPAGASIDATTGAFTWTTTATGVYPITVSVSDGGASTTATSVVGVRGTLFPGETGATLRASIRGAYAPALTLGYGPARDVMYGEIDREADGSVVGVYTGFSVLLPDGVDPSAYLAANGINAEHTWPQSKGAASEPGRSDIHNLFPAKDNVNSARSNKPYADIPDDQTETWYRFSEALTTAPTVDRDTYSESASGAFEPRESHKGNAARAAAYFFAIYESVSDASFLLQQKPALVAWDDADPADGAEVERTYEIAVHQGTINPFLLDTSLLDRMVADILPPDPIAIAAARALANGTLVTVDGIVTRAEGRLTRIQDGTAGIAVFETGGPFRDAVDAGDVTEGDEIRVTGTLLEFNGLREIAPSSFEVLSRGNALPAPVVLTVAEALADGEDHESELVRIDGLTLTTTDAVFAANTSYPASDGTGTITIRTPAAADGLLDGEPVPPGVVSFVGVLGEFNGAYQPVPVLPTDIRDETAPEISLVAGPRELTPPNHRMVAFSVAEVVASVSDGGQPLDPASVVVLSVSSDEAADGTGDGSTSSDVALACDGVSLRAERSGRGNGRVYTVTLGVADASGNVGTASFTVGVPKGNKAVVDDGAAYTVDSGCVPSAPAAASQPAAAAAPPAAATVTETALLPNVPNPFSSRTSIRFGLEEDAAVRLVVFDVTGRQVAVLAEGGFSAGAHAVEWRADGLAGGVYVVRLTAGAFADTQRVLLVR